MLNSGGLQAICTSLREAFYYIWMHESLMHALLTRSKTECMLEPPSDSTTAIEHHGFLKNLAFRVPPLLERADKAMDADGAGALEATAILTALGEAISVFKRWQLREASQTAPRYRVVSVKSLEHFLPLCKNHLEAFPQAFTFSSSLYERDLRICLISLLYLNQAIIDVYAAVREKLQEHFHGVEAFDMQYNAAEEGAAESARSLCMLVPWITQPNDTNVGGFNAFRVLHEVIEYYANRQETKELAWCEEVLGALKSKRGMDVRF